VRTLYRFEQNPTYDAGDLRRAYAIPAEREQRVMLPFATWYTPLPYAAQSLAALAGRLLDLRPLVTFYLGRIANVAAASLIVALAFLVAGPWRPAVAVVALLPMTLAQFGSWSADALTIAMSFLVCALMLRSLSGSPLADREQRLLVAAAFALGLCKPVYFCIPLLVWVVRSTTRRRVAVTVAVIAGVALSVIAARHAYYNPRLGLPVDPAQQLRDVLARPLAFAVVAARDLVSNDFYIESIIGRLGYNDLKLPALLRALELALLALVCVTSSAAMAIPQRLATMSVVVATAFGIALSQYLVWTIVGAPYIEGIQGRYFLPIVPLVIGAVAVRTRWRVRETYLVAMSGLLAACALLFVARQFWT
jgi:uncharacterized membrane protein